MTWVLVCNDMCRYEFQTFYWTVPDICIEQCVKNAFLTTHYYRSITNVRSKLWKNISYAMYMYKRYLHSHICHFIRLTHIKAFSRRITLYAYTAYLNACWYTRVWHRVLAICLLRSDTYRCLLTSVNDAMTGICEDVFLWVLNIPFLDITQLGIPQTCSAHVYSN